MTKKGAKRSKGSQPKEGYLPISGGKTVEIGDTVGPPADLIKPVDQKNVPNWGTQNAGRTRSKRNTAPEVFVDKKAKGTIGPVDPIKPGRSVTRGAIKVKRQDGSAALVKSGPRNRTTTVEGQPIYQKVTFPTTGPSLKGGARRTAWFDKKNGTYIIPNVDRDRFPGGKGGPLYYKITAPDLGNMIAEKRGFGNQTVSADDISMFIRSEAKKKSGSRVTPFDINDDLTGFEGQNRDAGFENVTGANLYRGNARDEVVFEPLEKVKPDIEIDVVGEPIQMIPENRQRQKQQQSDEPRGTYYFDKGRFLTRGKYNGKTSKSTQRRG